MSKFCNLAVTGALSCSVVVINSVIIMLTDICDYFKFIQQWCMLHDIEQGDV